MQRCMAPAYTLAAGASKRSGGDLQPPPPLLLLPPLMLRQQPPPTLAFGGVAVSECSAQCAACACLPNPTLLHVQFCMDKEWQLVELGTSSFASVLLARFQPEGRLVAAKVSYKQANLPRHWRHAVSLQMAWD